MHADRVAINMEKLGELIDRLALRALVIMTAYDLMAAHSDLHPLVAFLQAAKEHRLSDEDWGSLLKSWRGMCGLAESNVVVPGVAVV